MADAISHDFSFDLRNAYAREESAHRIYGDRLNPHVILLLDFQSYLTYGPNIVAYVAFTVLMEVGVL
jgi:hypothetical protein